MPTALKSMITALVSDIELTDDLIGLFDLPCGTLVGSPKLRVFHSLRPTALVEAHI